MTTVEPRARMAAAGGLILLRRALPSLLLGPWRQEGEGASVAATKSRLGRAGG